MEIHLIDGTYELFRYFYSPGASHTNQRGRQVGAVRRLLGSMLQLLEGGATHVGIATDHVIESFRNDLWPGYKRGDGIDPELFEQFPLAEEVLRVAGFTVWPMVEVEADDALAAAARVAAADDRVERVLICTPDKDLGQCVTDDGKVVQWDRRREVIYDRAGIIEKFGVPPESITDYLALVGDTADGFPGIKGWGAKSAASVLSRYGSIDDIPPDHDDWDVTVRGASKLSSSLNASLDDARLFKRLATLADDQPDLIDIDTLRWTGPTDEWPDMADEIDGAALTRRMAKLVP